MKRTLAIFALLALCLLRAQLDAQQPEPIAENVFRLEGTDHDSGIHYQKLILLLKSSDTKAATDVPSFTLECREQAGKRSLHWLVRFDGSSGFAFQPLRLPTASNPYPVPYPIANLKMRFEGYTRSEEFKRQWEQFPAGEFHYRNPGLGSANLDDPRHFMQWLTSLPNLRIGYVKPPNQPSEQLFNTKPLLDLIRKTNFCEP